MISFSRTTNRKLAAIAFLIIAATITGLILVTKKSQPAGDIAEKSRNTIVNKAKTDVLPATAASTTDHLASVAVIVLNNGKELPLEIKVGDKYINIPGPSSWPNGGDNGTSGSEKGRFLAGIIDTADVLKANGFNPDDTFSFVIGGTALNASNTIRVQGNHQANLAPNTANGYSEEYHTSPDEQGIWRSLKFKNIVLSYGQVPSLTDFLVAPPTSPATKPIVDQKSAANETSTLIYHDPSEMMADAKKAEKETQKYRDALSSANPAIRADGIKNLVLFDDQLPSDNSHPGVVAYIDQALTDRDATVREAALRSLDLWDGEIPMQTLSRVVLNDESAEIRLHALSALADRFNEQSTSILQQASHDPDSRVAQKARQLLDEFSP